MHLKALQIFVHLDIGVVLAILVRRTEFLTAQCVYGRPLRENVLSSALHHRPSRRPSKVFAFVTAIIGDDVAFCLLLRRAVAHSRGGQARWVDT